MKTATSITSTRAPHLVRRLGPFDATMIVMGGIVGSGIFMNSYLVARQVRTPVLILGAWVLGGIVALAGAFIYAELAARRPELGGQYAYIREAYHPLLAFVYGWSLLLVIQAGGMAAVAVTFARYFLEVTHAPLSDSAVAMLALTALTIVNCLGVRTGGTAHNILMVLKIASIAALVTCGYFPVGAAKVPIQPVLDRPISLGLFTSIAAATLPVLFAYGGWHTASFIAAEMRRPERDLPRGLLIGVVAVIVLYLSVNLVYLRALGVQGLAESTAPASAVMRVALGNLGATLIAAAIAVSGLGFLAQSMLTAPRVYLAMAEDGLFFRSVAWISPRTHVPVVAIALQGALAAVIALSGRYDQIVNYVVTVDFIFFGLTATCLFVFRKRGTGDRTAYRVPGHPVTTALFVAVYWLLAIDTVYTFPGNALAAVAIMLAGVPAYFFWRWWRRDS
jgi:APA family basic amino acid/polyamine antiporter